MALSERPAAVAAAGLCLRYGRLDALDDLSFDLHPGITGLIGVNGAGKTSLLRVLATDTMPTLGRIEWFGRTAPPDLERVRRRVGYMPQQMHLPAGLKVGDFLAYMAWLRAVPWRSRPGAVEAALTAVELIDRGRDAIGKLSGGMQRRLLLAQALLGDPDLLILDEPTAGLDPEQRVRVRELVRVAGRTRTTVISSHLMEDLVPVAGRVLMLDRGRLVFDGTVADLGARGASLIAPDSQLNVYEAAFLDLRTTEDGR